VALGGAVWGGVCWSGSFLVFYFFRDDSTVLVRSRFPVQFGDLSRQVEEGRPGIPTASSSTKRFPGVGAIFWPTATRVPSPSSGGQRFGC